MIPVSGTVAQDKVEGIQTSIDKRICQNHKSVGPKGETLYLLRHFISGIGVLGLNTVGIRAPYGTGVDVFRTSFAESKRVNKRAT